MNPNSVSSLCCCMTLTFDSTSAAEVYMDISDYMLDEAANDISNFERAGYDVDVRHMCGIVWLIARRRST